MAQNTAQKSARFPGAKVIGNPSDNRLMNVILDSALGCKSWEAPDLADSGHRVPALPLNELQARAHQLPPQALIPAGDPFVLNAATGKPDLAKVNAYRRGVDQPVVDDLEDASTTTYCRHVSEIGSDKLQRDQDLFRAFKSPFPDLANSLFTFMALRFVGTYDLLQCQALLNEPDPVTLIMDANGIVIDAMIE